MDLYAGLVRPLAFRLDPERVHHLAMRAIRTGLLPGRTVEALPREVFGVRFPNPVGLAAGFDKDGVALAQWERFGFGFVELGTVTPRPQPGNPKPRLFRLSDDGALVNRMGFNNEGSLAMARRLEGARPGIPYGINLGKNKETPEERAHEDYAAAFRDLRSFGGYFVVNVSSPNTPGLRALQSVEGLRRIVGALKEVDDSRPLLVKVAPDLDDAGLDAVAALAHEMDLAGIVATNTTVSRAGLRRDPGETGGLSGRPVRAMADRAIARLRPQLGGKVLIGVGGVFDAADVQAKLDLGCDLVQLYTGWIYGGPGLVPRMLKGLQTTQGSVSRNV